MVFIKRRVDNHKIKERYNMDRPSWYKQTKFIRSKKNHSWTETEVKQVYTLRVQRLPVDKIIRKLNLKVNRVQVYNVLRMLRKSRKGKCFQCGTGLTEGEWVVQQNSLFKKCHKCQEKSSVYKKEKRQENLKEGKCSCCGNAPALKGKTTCIYCLSSTHRRRLADGLCGTCGNNPISKNSITLCEPCLELNRTRIQTRRNNQRELQRHCKPYRFKKRRFSKKVISLNP
jgi:hypothetical protein